MRGRVVAVAGVVAGLVVGVAACSGGNAAPVAAPTTAAARQPPSPSGTPSRSAAASPSPSPAGNGAGLGTEQTFASAANGITVKVMATSYRVVTLSGENQEGLPAGAKVGVVGVRLCLTRDTGGTGITLTWHPWTLVTASGAVYTPVSAYGTRDWPGTLYPNDQSLTYHVGTCRSGLIPIPLTGGDAPVSVEYNTQGGVYDWRLG